MIINKEILRYLDLFGTKCSFYTEQRLKLYTPLGGILSITSFIAAILIFIYINLSSFRREDPSFITSSIVEEIHKIKFNEEKIWIPWKISDHKSNLFNHSGILFPIIKYYYRENRTEQLKSKILSYKLCNETSMVNKSDNILIDSELNQLYCIDTDDLYMGGSWSSNFIYFIEFNLYICKGGINYDENNFDCTALDDLNNYNNNSFLYIHFYFPTIQLQECEFKSPIIIKYYKTCSVLSSNISKIDRLYLQKVVLYDKLGIFDSRTLKHDFWGYSSINKDIYFIENKKNISTSKLYSFEVFVDSSSINYTRVYKTIFIILAQSLPLINIVHNLFKLLAKLFKLSSINRKMTELLFENLTEKPNRYENYLEEIKSKKNIKNIKNNNNKNNKNSKNNKNNAHNKNIKNSDENNIVNLTNKDNSKSVQNISAMTLFKKKDIKNDSPLVRRPGSPLMNHNCILVNDKIEKNFRINSINFKNLVLYKRLSLRYQEPAFKKKKKKFVSNKLFPLRYYLCSVFIKNIDITKNPFCMSKKFIKVYSFLCQLFDISSYCVLQREFNVIKNSLFDEKNIQLIEKTNKINVNSQSFMRDMNDAIGSHKFHILGRNSVQWQTEENKS